MSLSERDTYLYYLKTSLGPHQLARIAPRAQPEETSPNLQNLNLSDLYAQLSIVPTTKLVKSEILFIVPNLLNSEEKELLDKMIVAMKLDSMNVNTITYHKTIETPLLDLVITKEIETLAPKYIIVFGFINFFHRQNKNMNHFSDFDDFITSQSFHQARLISTHSITDLIQNPHLKKDTWSILQKVMKCF